MTQAILEFATFLGFTLTKELLGQYSKWLKTEITEEQFRKAATKYIKFDLRERHGNEHISVTLAKLIDYAVPRAELQRQARVQEIAKQLTDYNQKRLEMRDDKSSS